MITCDFCPNTSKNLQIRFIQGNGVHICSGCIIRGLANLLDNTEVSMDYVNLAKSITDGAFTRYNNGLPDEPTEASTSEDQVEGQD